MYTEQQNPPSKADKLQWLCFPRRSFRIGETNEEILIREFKKEIGADISVGNLKWVGEIFFLCGKVLPSDLFILYSKN